MSGREFLTVVAMAINGLVSLLIGLISGILALLYLNNDKFYFEAPDAWTVVAACATALFVGPFTAFVFYMLGKLVFGSRKT